MSSAREILNAYPNARSVVAWCELFVCVPPGPGEESAFEVIRRTKMNPAEVVAFLREDFTSDENTIFPPDVREVITREFSEPDFLRYIAARMGAV